jgi:hypothetical protein
MYIYNVIIFIVTVVIYTHIIFQLKQSNDMDIYHINDYLQHNFNEICDHRQPVKFNVGSFEINELDIKHISDAHGIFPVNVRSNDFTDEKMLYREIQIRQANEECNASKETFICENNNSFMKESGLYNYLFEIEKHLKPPLTSNVSYDVMFGSENSTTPLRYELYYRTFLMCKSGKFRLKLTPPVNQRYLDTIKDYENFEFRSEYDPWVDKDGTMRPEFLDVTLSQGDSIYIPAYWWYSISYDEPETLIYKVSYTTYMNGLTIMPEIMLHYLQLMNIRYRIAPSLDTKQDDINKNE